MAVTQFDPPQLNPLLNANLMAVSFIEPESWAIEDYTAETGILHVFDFCDLDLVPMSFIYKLDPYCREVHQMCKYELCLYFKPFESYRHTDRQTSNAWSLPVT